MTSTWLGRRGRAEETLRKKNHQNFISNWLSVEEEGKVQVSGLWVDGRAPNQETLGQEREHTGSRSEKGTILDILSLTFCRCEDIFSTFIASAYETPLLKRNSHIMNHTYSKWSLASFDRDRHPRNHHRNQTVNIPTI